MAWFFRTRYMSRAQLYDERQRCVEEVAEVQKQFKLAVIDMQHKVNRLKTRIDEIDERLRQGINPPVATQPPPVQL